MSDADGWVGPNPPLFLKLPHFGGQNVRLRLSHVHHRSNNFLINKYIILLNINKSSHVIR